MIPAVEVVTSIQGIECHVGTAYFHARHNELSTSFSYAPAYLANSDAFAIDPSLPLCAAQWHTDGLPGCFQDSSPDRWGRMLILKKKRAEAIAAAEAMHTISEVDYLLGVSDATRQGALRFRHSGSSEFESPGTRVPPLRQLPSLMHASRSAETDNAGIEYVKQLLDAGSSSLGGARPKASITDDGKLYIAKFSHRHDEWDVIAWEKTALDIARACGICTPASQLHHIGDESVLLVERFDRADGQLDGTRIPYLSALSLLGAKDGSVNDYADLCEHMNSFVHQPHVCLRELFCRVVFSVLINNTDDHMRNTGFLHSSHGWRIAPIFDVNPNFDADALRATGILGEFGNHAAKALIELSSYCLLPSKEAIATMERVLTTTERSWSTFALMNGCCAAERRLFKTLLATKAQQLRSAISEAKA